MVGTVLKAKAGNLKDEVREGFSRHMRKEFTGVLKGVSSKRRLSVRFQYSFDKDMNSNQLASVTVYRRPMTEA